MSDIKERVAKMAERVAQKENGEPDTPLEMVDQAIDTMIASAMIIDENLPKVETQNVPQRAALDTIKELMNEAIAPYLADIAKAAEVFGD